MGIAQDIQALNDTVARESAFVDRLTNEVGKVIVGQQDMIERLLIGLLCNGHVLLEGAPDWLDVGDMQERIVANVPGVIEIHHVHVWGLTPQQLMLTMHVTLGEDVPSQSGVVRGVKAFLQQEYGIGHSTIEVEIDGCADH